MIAVRLPLTWRPKCALLAAAALTFPNEVPAQERTLDSILRFEGPRGERTTPYGWGGGPAGTIWFDSVIVHGGAGAARLERGAQSAGSFTALTKRLPADIAGEMIELRGFLRTDGVTGFAGLWLREDAMSAVVQFDNMQDRGLAGTTDWTEYVVRLPLDERARELVFGVLLSGEGRVWADDLQLLVDGKPIADAPKRERVATILDTDTTFSAGSGIAVSALTPTQTEHIAVLGLVWGFLKYHHPRVAAGDLHWDYELFRVLPGVLRAADRARLRRVLLEWVDRVGVPERCGPCASEPADAQLLPSLAWIRDTALLGPALSHRMRQIHRNRFAGPEHFYVSQVPGVANPVFDRELPYAHQRPPDAGYRILALLRLWTIIEYSFPYRDLLDDDWHAVLRESLPRFVAGSDWDAYRLALLALIARVRDTHANLWGGPDVRPPRGDCAFPLTLRFVEGLVTVTHLLDGAWGEASGLEIGDVVETVDGRSVDSLIEAWSPYYPASNRPTRLRDIARSLPRGACGAGSLGIKGPDGMRTVTAPRIRAETALPRPHDRPGDTFQFLSDDVAYIKLSSIRAQDIPGYLERASATRGLVIDIRNYPAEFVVFALGARLVEEPTPFARFTRGSLNNPGAFMWSPPVSLQPEAPAYKGKVVVLVDEVSTSQAEYTAMALRAGPRAVVVGSTTAGADGNVSPIPLPGGLRTAISGIGVFYPDRRPTQRIGIIPDVTVVPTIAGVREGRDEVLEEALRQILGPGADEEAIRRMAAVPRGP